MEPGIEYRCFSDSDLEQKPGSRFFVFVSGNTGDVHRHLVQELETHGHTEVDTDEDCDYVLLFCPVSSRVGTDVGETLRKVPAGKATVLVVMHHTFDPDYVVADSRRLVDEQPNVQLIVDCLFYENHFLDCQRNADAWCRVKDHMRPSQAPSNTLRRVHRIPRCSEDFCFGFVCGVVTGAVVAAVVAIAVVATVQVFV